MFDITVYSGKLLAGAGNGGWQSFRTLPLMLMLMLLTGSRAWGRMGTSRWLIDGFKYKKTKEGAGCVDTHTHEPASPLGDKLNG